MKIHFTINSFERFELLRNLIDQIINLSKDYKITATIYDDGSINQGFEELKYKDIPGVKWVSLQRHGKKNYYKIWNRLLKKLPEADIYIFIPDDVSLKGDFLESLKLIYNSISGDVGTVNFLTEKNRSLIPSWGSNYPEIEYLNGKRFLNSGWFDLCGIITKPAIKHILRNPIEISPSRWVNNPLLSSGVGDYVSRLLRRKFKLLSSPVSLVKHLGDESKMNEVERKGNKLTEWDFPHVLAGMATITGREAECRISAKSMLPYVDRLFITFNNCPVPQWAKNNPKVTPIEGDNSIGDGEKFRPLDFLKNPGEFGFKDFYYFSIDDDLIYPVDYVSKYIRAIELRNRKAIICTHGKVMPKQVKKFYGSHQVMFHTSTALDKPAPVNLPGTGTVGFHVSTIKFNTDKILAPNMGDIWLGIEAQKQKVPIIAIDRPRNWIKILGVKNTIYDQHKNRDQKQTKHFNSIQWGLNK